MRRRVLPKTETRVEDGREVHIFRYKDTGSLRREALVRWCEWQFPWPGAKGRITILDVQGVGRLWNGIELNAMGTEYKLLGYLRRKSAHLDHHTKWEPTIRQWVLGPMDPTKESFLVRVEREPGRFSKTPYVSNQAALIFWGSLMARTYHRDLGTFYARKHRERFEYGYKTRLLRCEQFFKLLRTLRPEWEVMAGGAVRLNVTPTLKRPIVWLRESHRYYAEPSIVEPEPETEQEQTDEVDDA